MTEDLLKIGDGVCPLRRQTMECSSGGEVFELNRMLPCKRHGIGDQLKGAGEIW